MIVLVSGRHRNWWPLCVIDKPANQESEELMRFFTPTKDDKSAEEWYEAITKFAADQVNWKISDRRIYSITYYDQESGQTCEATVGQRDPASHEDVWAILETSGPYLVCTWNRCVRRGFPVLVGQQEVRSVIDFEE